MTYILEEHGEIEDPNVIGQLDQKDIKKGKHYTVRFKGIQVILLCTSKGKTLAIFKKVI